MSDLVRTASEWNAADERIGFDEIRSGLRRKRLRKLLLSAVETVVDTPFRMLATAAMLRMSRFGDVGAASLGPYQLGLRSVRSAFGWRELFRGAPAWVLAELASDLLPRSLLDFGLRSVISMFFRMVAVQMMVQRDASNLFAAARALLQLSLIHI